MAFRATALIDNLCLRWVLAGALPTIVWCCIEVWLRTGGDRIAGFLLATMLGAAAGGLLGLLVCWIRSEKALIATLLLPVPIINYKEVHWVIQRTADLVTLAGTISVLTVALFVGAVVALFIRIIGYRNFPYHRGWTRFVGLCVGFLIAILVLEHLQGRAIDLARVIPYLYIILGTTILIRGWYKKWIFPVLALFCAGCLLWLREPYLKLALIVGWTAMASSMLTLHFWIPVSHNTRLSIKTCLILSIALSALGWGAHHLIRTNPLSWRSSKGSGMLSMLVDLGHRLSDFDGDGHGAIFSQYDCEPFDSTAFPGAHEVPGNENDENCLAGPMRGDTLRWVTMHEAINPRPRPWRGDIVVVLVDTLRFDDAMEPHLVNFQTLIRNGLNFERAYSMSSFTSFVLPGLFAGRLPSTYPFKWLGKINGIPSITLKGLPAMLRKAGYDTAFAGGITLTKSPYFSPDVFGYGFRVFRRTSMFVPPSRVLYEALEAWRLLDSAKPRFLFVHFMWTHIPYKNRGSYRRAIRDVDRAFGTLRKKIGNQILWVLLADHGDAFGEHGDRHHASSLFEEQVHVPLIIAGPSIESRSVSRVSPIRSLMPTLMAMVDPEMGPSGKGPYLCLNQPNCDDLPVPMALEMQDIHLHGLISGHRKIIRDLRREYVVAFDLARDPVEKHPLDPVPTDLMEALLGWEENVFGIQTSDHFWPYK